MALTINQLAFALRLTADDGTAPDASIVTELTRLASVADALIADYAPMAPETVRDEAKRLAVGYLYDGPDFNPGGTGLLYVNAFRNSGAQALLSPWRVRRAGLIGPAGAAAVGGGAAAGLDRAALIALIDARIAAGGGGGNGDMPAQPGAGLTSQQLADLQSSIDREGISISGRTIEYVDHEGRSVSIDVPGITVLDESTILLSGQGSASAALVDELIFVGANVTAARVGNAVTVTISGLTVAQVNGLIAGHESVGEFAEFEAALRTETAIVSAVSVNVSAPNIASRITGNPEVPAADHDRELVVRVGAGLHHRIDVSTLRAKAAATLPTTLDDTNSVPFVDGDDTFRLGRQAGDDEILFSASTASTYVVSITDSLIDIQPEVRRSAAPLATTIRGAIQSAVTGDVTMAADGDKLAATLKPNNVDPADLRITDGRIAGKFLRISDDVGSLVGVDAPDPGVYGTKILHDGALTGIAVTRADDSRAGNATDFTTTEYLAAGATGEFHYELTATLSGRSNTSIRFSGTGSAPDLEADTSGIVFASRLRSQSLFVLGGAVEGQEICSFTVYATSGTNRTQTLGVVRAYLVTQEVAGRGRAVRYSVNWDGSLGVYSFSVGFNMKLSFLASDPGQASSYIQIPAGGTTGDWLLRRLNGAFSFIGTSGFVRTGTIRTGKLIRKTASGWEEVDDRVPIPPGIATGQVVRKTATGWEAHTPAAGGGSASLTFSTIAMNTTNGAWSNVAGSHRWTATIASLSNLPSSAIKVITGTLRVGSTLYTLMITDSDSRSNGTVSLYGTNRSFTGSDFYWVRVVGNPLTGMQVDTRIRTANPAPTNWTLYLVSLA